MKKYFLTYIFLLISINFCYSQEGWFTLLAEYGTTGFYTGIHFTNGNTGYLTTSWGNAHNNGGYTMKTTNGGINWLSVEGSVARYGLFFLNEQTGWTCGGYWDDAGKRSREVFRTTNAGLSFQRIFIDSLLQSFRRMFFADINNGWITTTSNILKTTNSGANWTECANLNVNSIYFNDAATGWAVTPTGIIYKTTNGGTEWFNQHMVSGNAFTYVTFLNHNTGWVSGAAPNIFKTTNAGANWIAYVTGATALISNIKFPDSLNGWACSQSGEIFHSSNGGINWLHQTTVDSFLLSGLSFPNQLTGYVYGICFATPYNQNIKLLKTTTGGVTFIHNINNEIPADFKLYQNYPNPFNPVTKIKFDTPPLPSPKGRGQWVRLIIYDILGREVATLVNEQLQTGTFEIEWDGTNYPSGVYFYKLITFYYNETKRMVLLK